jgi:hypothetical protein
MAHPDLMKLMVWSSLEQKAGTAAARIAVHHVKAPALMTAQDAAQVGTGFPRASC